MVSCCVNNLFTYSDNIYSGRGRSPFQSGGSYSPANSSPLLPRSTGPALTSSGRETTGPTRAPPVSVSGAASGPARPPPKRSTFRNLDPIRDLVEQSENHQDPKLIRNDQKMASSEPGPSSTSFPKPRNAKFEENQPNPDKDAGLSHQAAAAARIADVVDGNQNGQNKSENGTEDRILESKETSSLSQFSEGKGENKMQVNHRKV